MADEPAPGIDPLESLKEANRRRGGIGTFLVAVLVFGLFMIPGILLLAYVSNKGSKDSSLDMQIMAGSFAAAFVGTHYTIRAFTRWRVRRLDEEAKAKAGGTPPAPTSP